LGHTVQNTKATPCGCYVMQCRWNVRNNWGHKGESGSRGSSAMAPSSFLQSLVHYWCHIFPSRWTNLFLRIRFMDIQSERSKTICSWNPVWSRKSAFYRMSSNPVVYAVVVCLSVSIRLSQVRVVIEWIYVCVCVCVCVIKLIVPRPGTLSFLLPKTSAKFDRNHHKCRPTCRWGKWKSATK